MATKSLLLSCLLMGLGITQHPASEGSQTTIAFSASSAAAFSASSAASFSASSAGLSASSAAAGSPTGTVLSPLEDHDQCDQFEIEDAAIIFCFCALQFPDWLGPFVPEKCEAVPELDDFADFVEEECFKGAAPYICQEIRMQHKICSLCPQDEMCQDLSQVLKKHDVLFWDDGEANDKSCPLDDHGEGLHHHRDATAFVFRSNVGDNLERSDADEPPHHVLKAIYEDCEASETPKLQVRCIVTGISRAKCEELSNPGCEDVDKVLDEVFDADDAPAATDEFWSRMNDILQECRHAASYDSCERCYLTRVVEVCPSNPGDELCKISLATLIH